MAKVAFAVVAHPDDVEFVMAGTLLRLGEAGYALHTLNVANGSCGTATMSREEIIVVRTEEARAAAAVLGATFHEPLVDDLQIYYTPELAARLGAIVREVRPEILLIPAMQDYMEDHMNVSRLMVTAAFCRGAPNFATDPPVAPYTDPVALYHAAPAGLKDQLRNPMRADLFVDITDMLPRKRQALACHRSQKDWLDVSQGMGSYLAAMESLSAEMGRMSGRFRYAEAWRRHLHLGFAGSEDFDPLSAALGEAVAAAP